MNRALEKSGGWDKNYFVINKLLRSYNKRNIFKENSIEKVMEKPLNEIITKDKMSLERIITKAYELQNKKIENERKEGISRKTLYEIASEVGIKEEYIEKAIQSVKKDDKENIFYLAQKLGLKDKIEGANYKTKRVNLALLNILKKAKKFKRKSYNAQEIEEIYQEKGISIDIKKLIKEGFDCPSNDYLFSEEVDNKGNKTYLLHKKIYYDWD